MLKKLDWKRILANFIMIFICVAITPCMWFISIDGVAFKTMPYSAVSHNLGVLVAALFGGPLPAIMVAVSGTVNPFAIFISTIITLLCSFIRNRNLCRNYAYSIVCACVMSVIINILSFADSGNFEILSYIVNALMFLIVFCTYTYFRNKYSDWFERWFPARKGFRNAKVYRRISLKSELLIIINIITLLCISLVSTQNDTLNQNEEYKIITEEGNYVSAHLKTNLIQKFSTEQFDNQSFLTANGDIIKESLPRYNTILDIKSLTLCRKNGGKYTVIDQCYVETVADTVNGSSTVNFSDSGVYGTEYESIYFIDAEYIDEESEMYVFNLNTPVFECELKDDISLIIKAETAFSDNGYRVFSNTFYITVSALIVVNIFAAWYIDKRIAAPVNRMTEAVSGYAYTDEKERIGMKEAFHSLGINTGNEIEALYTAYEKTMSDMANYIGDIHKKSKQIAKFQHNIIVTMADIIESRDENTGGHIRRTAAYVEIIARRLQSEGKYPEILTENYINDMIVAAPLHDMGKIHVSDTILNKAGKLTDEEFGIMKTHTTAGKKMLENATETLGVFSYLSVAIDMANYHHEWWNGKGYPEGLAGEDIPLCARIMAVADVFDALISKRCYKDAMSLEKAYSIIREETGTHFDPEVSEAFFASGEDIEKAMNEFAD